MLKQSGQDMIALMFDEGEECCVSHDGYGYHSIPVSDLEYQTVLLKSPKGKEVVVPTERLSLVALNPVSGWRRDENVTSYRSFLVEVDDGTTKEQYEYIKNLDLPYSVCVFSGNKSLHFGIFLSQPLPNYDIYYMYSTWILKAVTLADQKTKNPTRSIRLAGGLRDNGNLQHMVEMRSRVDLDVLDTWLSQYAHLKPSLYSSEDVKPVKLDEKLSVPMWVEKKLVNGVDRSKGRNNEWFIIGSEFGKANYEESEVIRYLEQFYQEEHDFKRSEWAISVKSGVKNGRKKVGLI